jgi:hypothetical protein
LPTQARRKLLNPGVAWLPPTGRRYATLIDRALVRASFLVETGSDVSFNVSAFVVAKAGSGIAAGHECRSAVGVD